jgi:hypothetical protein
MPRRGWRRFFDGDNPAWTGDSVRVSEGTRTPDRRDHNPELYQLSYAHQEGVESRARAGRSPTSECPRQDSNLGPAA